MNCGFGVKFIVRIRMMNTSDADCRFRHEMLMEAAFWRGISGRPPIEEALLDPELAKLVTNWGRAGDAGWVAEDSRRVRMGACWYRFWTDANHSWGYVAAEIPEVAIGVIGAYRRRGIGAALLRSLLSYAAESGVGHVSLSVEKDNHAHKLYTRLGFTRVGELGNAWTMVANTTGHS